ncbi:MAG TPA: selenocysteine-specific translation elongation factor [Solirubrobacteraceae bacterium]|jgi:selenocysteine-specific elongation factor|nr:selenocysteine-specific translation elongation factor [Solirubrobacteraceae bacterium]
MSAGPLTLGTAGHIDHGKTTLIGALTGVDTDRLPEEKARGISIALGYAQLQVPSGHVLSVIDVPGHERFVRTMVAGATGIDLFLMVVAANDGVMPQTREHAAVLAALAVERGVVAVTKADIADPRRAVEQARELLPNCEAIPCSAHTGRGLEKLLSALDRVLDRCASRAFAPGEAVLHIDRVFTATGHGTVVTGTLWSGALARGETLALLPGDTPVRIRRLEVHNEPRTNAQAGQRVAVNLSGVRARSVRRGDVLATPGSLRESYTLDCVLELEDAQHAAIVHIHHGTRDVRGRLAALGEDLWQLRLERPLLAADGDRLVLRRPSPPGTLGGGVVLDASAQRRGRGLQYLERLRRRRDGQPEPISGLPAAPSGRAGSAVNAGPREALAATPGELLALERRLREAGTHPLTPQQLDAAPHVLRALTTSGAAIRISGQLYVHAEVVLAARELVIELIERDGSVTLAGLRNELHASRKPAQALLEHFDATRVTRRLPDDSRILSPRTARERVIKHER